MNPVDRTRIESIVAQIGRHPVYGDALEPLWEAIDTALAHDIQDHETAHAECVVALAQEIEGLRRELDYARKVAVVAHECDGYKLGEAAFAQVEAWWPEGGATGIERWAAEIGAYLLEKGV